MPNNQKAFIVMGLPRSGTSAVAGILHNLGIHMLRPHSVEPRKDKYNAKGYFENLQVVNINVINSNTRNFIGMIEAAKNANNGRIVDLPFDVSYGNAIKNASLKYNLFGFKDPRFCFPNLLRTFVEELENYVDQENIKIILTKRNLSSTIASLRNVDFSKKIKYDDNELHEILRERWIKTQGMLYDLMLNYHIVNYDSLIDHYELKKFVIENLAQFCEVPVKQKALDFIEPELKRF